MECNEVRKRRQRITRTRAAACRKPGRPVQFSAERKEAPVCRAVGETKNDALPPMQQKEAGTEAANLLPTFHVKFVAVFPVLSIILNCLAIQGIRKDEALVRSLDRIR